MRFEIFNILELMDGDWSHADPDPPWAREGGAVKKEDIITEAPIRLFTDIFKEKPSPEEVEKYLDEVIAELDALPITGTEYIYTILEGRTPFSLYMANYYRWLEDKPDHTRLKIFFILVGWIGILGVIPTAVYLFCTGYLF